MRLITTILLVALAFAFGPLSLAAFSGINPGVANTLRLLSALEGTLALRLTYGGHSLAELDPYWRGLLYMGLASLCIWLAAFLKPRARPDRAAGSGA